MKRLISLLALSAFAFTATPAQAEPWTTEQLNRAADQTSFVVNSGCSGTLIDHEEHRLILTNYHCIDNFVRNVEREVTENGVVTKKKFEELQDVPVSQTIYADFREVGKSEYKTQIVFKDKSRDLALLQIRAKNLTQTQSIKVFSNHGKVQRGQKVWVIGNPLGYEATIFSGIISSTNRMYRVPWANQQEVPFFQTDAGVTGGNSGGMMLDAEGRLIGVPAAAVRGTVVGLAIPYTFVQEFLTDACYEEVWNSEAKVSFKDCTADREKSSKPVSMKDLLDKLIKQHE